MIRARSLSGVVVFVFALIALLLQGCPPATAPPDAGELYQLISVTDPYTAWGSFPETPGTIDSNPPHGPRANVFINGKVEAALDNFTGELPDGSIIIKESFDAQMMESGDSLTVMWKVADYDPGNHDWFWASYAFDGTVRASGQVAGCIACHGAARDNDFVFLHDFTSVP